MAAVENGIEQNEHQKSNNCNDHHVEQGRVDCVVDHLNLQGIIDVVAGDLEWVKKDIRNQVL